mgnify:CR=1 FL=1|tara:strand:+ start:5331 stop:7091 length:1761 start_codon:yes stop_codon:yes gene_type:complete
MKEKHIYIVSDSIDSNFLEKSISSLTRENIITLSPDAFYILKGTDNNISRSNSLFRDEKHEIAVKAVNQQELKLIREIEESESMTSITKEILLNQIHAVLSIYYMISLTIPEAPIYKVFFEGDFLDFDQKKDACFCLLRKVSNGHPFKLKTNKPWFPSIINLLNNLSSRILSKKNIYIFSTFVYGTPWVSKEVQKIDKEATFVSFVSTKGTRLDLLRSFGTLISALLGMKYIKFVIPHSSCANSNEYKEIIQSLDDQDAAHGLMCFEESIMKRVALANSSSDQISLLVKQLKPLCMIAHEMRSPMSMASAFAMKNNKIPVYLASHGTHLSTGNEIIDLEQKSLARGILTSPLADYTIAQSAMSKDAIRKFYPEFKTLEYDQINWGYPNNKDILANKNNKDILANKKIKFLHASTYKGIGSLRPWIFETSDEFHKSLSELIQIFNRVGSADLLIRHREIGEMSINTYEDLIHKENQNIYIKTDLDNPFLEDLDVADVVIANFSTTIEEALTRGKYVILWGEGNRYSHENSPYISQDLVFSAHSTEEMYNIVNLLIKKIEKENPKLSNENIGLKDSQKAFIQRIVSGN